MTTHCRATDERLSALDAFTSEGGRPSPAQPEHERQTAEFGITYDGLHYGYNGYRYDRLADAVAYASLMRSRPTQKDSGGPFKLVKMYAEPTDEERTLMATFAIEFADGAYRFDGFRYDALSDALNYAKLTLQRKGA